MEGKAQGAQYGGEGVVGPGFFSHGLFRLSAGPAPGINQKVERRHPKVEAGPHLSMAANHSSARCPAPRRRATVGTSRRAAGPAPWTRGWQSLCSSPGET
ncbi:hypothetical protein GCM10010211_08320 [Streptomyces albospinus]|uniref:Uncharacterized protein n=1 Tax=Streptomyces albospinus TaxID=285515 RepID=A0ABQ2US35_9ACTN|nr:hypothetical protein GCM10010211_08320 [Streptomyces albospinus]